MKAIETTYRGYKFRSRLEARYAVLFDSLEVTWEYEAEGFEADDGTTYLPDFWLPDHGWFVEIKGSGTCISAEERRKIRGLDDNPPESAMGVIVCVGMPSVPELIEYGENEPRVWTGNCWHLRQRLGVSIEEFAKAVHAARSARFEFGDRERW